MREAARSAGLINRVVKNSMLSLMRKRALRLRPLAPQKEAHSTDNPCASLVRP